MFVLVMVEFAECVDMVLDALSKGNLCDVDESLFIDLAGLVHEGMRDIRKAVAAREVTVTVFFIQDNLIFSLELLLMKALYYLFSFDFFHFEEMSITHLKGWTRQRALLSNPFPLSQFNFQLSPETLLLLSQ